MSAKRVAILISGSGSNMEALIRDMQGADHPATPCGVISNNPDAGGLAKAQALGVPTAVVDHRPFGKDRAAFDAALGAALDPLQPDIICLAGFMRILTDDFIAARTGRILNIHPSLLPLFRGLHTHQQALDAGVTVHGASVHLVTPELDGGPILGQTVMAVRAGDTPATLAARLLPLEHQLYVETLRKFAAGSPEKLAIFP